MTLFQEYLNHGWRLCRVEPGGKGPRAAGWNEVGNCVQDPTNLSGAGLMHAYSKTCALDLDRMDDAAQFLQQHGIILADLLADPASVQILSGRPNRGKLLYALQTPLPSKSLCEGALELRCGTANGKTVQDVLPPSLHPDTGLPYEWKGDWRTLPPIPPALLALWQRSIIVESQGKSATTGVAVHRDSLGFQELQAIVARLDPSMGYHDWLKVGMGIQHTTGGSDEGLAIWDEWSATSDKYSGLADLRSHWVSFRGSETPVTLDSLRRMDRVVASDFEDVSNATAWPEDAVEAPRVVPGFQFLSLVDLFKRPEPDWIIKGILPEAAFGVIYGQPSAGKTFTICDIALSIALGQPWRGRAVKQGRVAYIAAEDDRGVQMRFASGLAARGYQDAPIRVLPTAPVLTDKAQQASLLEAIKREKPLSMIIFDTLAAVTPGMDGNTAQDMGELVSYCYKIHKATGALVMMIHHSGKTEGRGMLGSIALPAASDVIWEISKDEIQHEMRIEKLKNATIGDSYQFRLLPVANSCIVEWL